MKEEDKKKFDLTNTQSKSSGQTNQSIARLPSVYNALRNSFEFIPYWYGGSQMWFEGKDFLITEFGCGAVAACNVMMYHARNFGRPLLYPYPAYNYDYFMQNIYNMYYGYVIGPATLNTLRDGVIGYTQVRGVSGYASSAVDCWTTRSTTFADLVDLIKSSIDGNNPVLMLIGPNYAPNNYAQEFQTHWVTITSYKYQDNKFYVSFSSWGECYTFPVELGELVHNRLFVDAVAFYK